MSANVLDVIAQARAAGLDLTPNGERLRVCAPSQDVLDAWRETLREHKPAILAALADEAATFADQVAWRVAALRPYVARLGPLDPIRLPSVREGVPPLCEQDALTGDITYHKHCASCGEPREVGQLYHCRACQRAHHIALLEVREGVQALVAASAENRGAA